MMKTIRLENKVRPGMKLALVSTHPPGRGTLNEYGFHFLKSLRQKPEVAEIVLLADYLENGAIYQFPDEEGLAPVRVVPCWRFGAWDNSLRILAAVKKERVDGVIYTIQFATFGSGKIPAALGLLGPQAVKRAGFPTIVLLHNIMETVDLNSAGFTKSPLVEWVIRKFGRLATQCLLKVDLVTLTIPRYVEILRDRYGAENVALTPHGSFDEMEECPNSDFPPGPRRILAFGKFGTYKKIEVLLEAFDALQKTRREPLELVIAGTDSPNAPGYLADVQSRYQHVPNVHFSGYVAEEDVPEMFRSSAVVVFPYVSTTGSSGVLHQAGSYGRAAVLPLLGDFADVIKEEGYDGEFFEPEDRDSLVRALQTIFDNEERRAEITMRNYYASTGLPLGDVVDWYLIHLQTILSKEQKATPAVAA